MLRQPWFLTSLSSRQGGRVLPARAADETMMMQR